MCICEKTKDGLWTLLTASATQYRKKIGVKLSKVQDILGPQDQMKIVFIHVLKLSNFTSGNEEAVNWYYSDI